jgi:hypothetical protein
VLRLPCLIPHENKPVAQRLAIAVGHYLNIKVLIMRCVLEGLKRKLRIRNVYPGSEFFHPGSRIPSQKDSGSRIVDQ